MADMKTEEEIRKIVSENECFDFPYDGEISDDKLLLVGFINYKTACEKYGSDKVLSTIYFTSSDLYSLGKSDKCYLINK